MLCSQLLTPGTVKNVDEDQVPNSGGTHWYFIADSKPKEQVLQGRS